MLDHLQRRNDLEPSSLRQQILRHRLPVRRSHPRRMDPGRRDHIDRRVDPQHIEASPE
jgi:hypothetical protein